MTGQRRRRRSRSSGAVAAAPPLLLLLLFLLATCLLRDIAPLASAQPEGYEGDDDNDAPSFDEDDEGARSSPLPPKPSIDDVAPNALVSTLRGSPRWKLPDLLVRRTAVIECEGGQDFRVFVARDATLLAQAIASGSPPAWCGWRRAAARAARGALRGGGGNPGALTSLTSRLLGPFAPSLASSRPPLPPPCEARLPTFGPSAVAVMPRSGNHRQSSSCSVIATRRLDLSLVARLVVGVSLFLLARPLAASASFRVSAGAVSFALASLIVVLFLVARSVPNKRQLAVAAAAMGSGALTIARLLFGHWIPTLPELASAKVLGTYAACSLAVGAAVAFWFDDPEATKAHAILAAALRLAGLGLVAGGVSSPAVGFALAAFLALVGFAGPRFAGPWAEWRERRRRRRMEAERRRAAAATTTEGARSPLRQREEASPSLQQQGQQQHNRSPGAAALPLLQRRSASVSTTAFESPERSTFPASSSPLRTGGGGGGVDGAGGGRLPSRSPTGPLLSRRPASPAPPSAPRPPPPPASSAAAIPLPSAHEEEESERQRRRRTTTTSEHRPSSQQQRQQQQSGWQREEPQQQQQQRSYRAAAAATTSAATSTPTRSFQRPQSQSRSGSLPPLPLLRSPLVDRGLLLNEATGKTIKIGAATYNRLVLEGYTIDEGRGTLSPPVRARRGRQGSGEGEGGGGGGGGTTSLRPRTRNG